MNVIEIQSYGAPEVLVPGSRPDPVAGAGELLIRVSASGINRPDVLQRTGNYPATAKPASAMAAASPDTTTPATSRPGMSEAPGGTG